MEVITIESQAFKNLTSKIDMIVKFITTLQSQSEEEPSEGRVDSPKYVPFSESVPVLYNDCERHRPSLFSNQGKDILQNQ